MDFILDKLRRELAEKLDRLESAKSNVTYLELDVAGLREAIAKLEAPDPDPVPFVPLSPN